MKKILLLISILGSCALYANHPSFDCNKVKKDSAEGIICTSNTLMNLDRELASVYKKALTKSRKNDMLKAHQRGWIKGRNDCWKADNELKCMEDEYIYRIDELKKKYALGAISSTSVKETNTYSFEKTLSLQGITFHVATTGEGSLRQLTVTPKGLVESNSIIKQEIDGMVTGVEVADINADGSPEIYIYVSSAGSGAYGTLVAYSANHKKSLSEIYLAPLEDDKKNSVGYMGHDEFTIIENSFARRFPVYNEEDANCCPKGGTRQLQYKLVMGEASWLLKLVKITEF